MVRAPHDALGRRPQGHVRAVVQLHNGEVLEVHVHGRRLPDAHGSAEAQPGAQRLVVHVGVVLGDALRVPVPVRPDRQHALVPANSQQLHVSGQRPAVVDGRG